MKKFLLLLMMAGMVSFTMTACGDKKAEEGTEETEAVEDPAAEGTEESNEEATEAEGDMEMDAEGEEAEGDMEMDAEGEEAATEEEGM